jgi:uncharacterized membrane protein
LRFPLGTIVLIVVGVLIYFGLAHRVLDRMRLTDRAALGFILAMILGGFLNVTVARRPELVVNIGGSIVPLAIATYLVATADESKEKVRGVVAAIVTGGAVYALTKVINPEEQTMLLDPIYIFSIAAGLIGYLAGRSRRAAFIAGISGIIIADLALWVELAIRRQPGRAWLGGAGVFDSTVIAGLLAVLLAELVGETREKLQGGSRAIESRREDRADGSRKEGGSDA